VIDNQAIDSRLRDRILFQVMRQSYEKKRPRWRLILEMRAVAKINIIHVSQWICITVLTDLELVQFHLHDVNQAISQPWQWPPDPTQSHMGWSYVVPKGPKPERPEVDSKWLMALWNGESMVSTEQNKNLGLQKNRSFSSILSWIMAHLHSIFKPIPAQGSQRTISRHFWVFDRIPKRVGSTLELKDHHSEYLKGWGVEVEEGFHISWEISLFVCLLALGAVGLAVGLARKNDNLAYLGVAGLPVPLMGYLLTIYITASKDNKA